MGKKVKVGKQRRDKYYRLAKEAGLRSRAVFKLTQLNKKFEFLQRSQVLIDLCAAPGGWLQVAAKHMPVSSLIIGVDLVPIKSMPNVITLQNDITTESCRQAIKSHLQTWLADCVLHDGAPNIGKNWGHDAFMQAQLTLSALRCATEVLKRGGWFITKIFRSKDHPALIEVFKKLFKKVYVTKPEASRAESAEIYAVCRAYLKPDKVDPKLLDPKCVFVDLNLEPEAPKLNLMKPEKRRKRAEGYAEGDNTLHHSFSARSFVEAEGGEHLRLLADAHELRLDVDGQEDTVLARHPATTDEVRACLADIKVLGRKELRELLNWRKVVRKHLADQQAPLEKNENEGPEEELKPEVDEEVELDEYVKALKTDEQRVAKKKRKKLMAEKRSLKQKLDLKMVIPGDMPDVAEENDLFSLKKIKNKERTLKEFDAGDSSADDDDMQGLLGDDTQDLDFDEIGDLPLSVSDIKGKQSEDNKDHSLLVDLDYTDKETKVRNKTDAWFEKEIFNDLIDEEDEDAEIERAIASKKRKYNDPEYFNEPAERKLPKQKATYKNDVSDIEKYSSEDEEHEVTAGPANEAVKLDNYEEEPEIIDADHKPDKVRKLDAEGISLAEMWLHSSKTRRDLIDSAYNRYANNDENLPDWFVTDEKKHHRPSLPITKEAVEEYRQRMKEINARPIKKVAEAKARKKKRGMRRAERAKKRAEAVIENSDMTEAQKAQEVKKIYKQSMSNNKKKTEVTYVVAKKSQAGRRVHRPAGVQGRFKVVDKRLKKDNDRKSGGQKKKAKGGRGGPKRKR